MKIEFIEIVIAAVFLVAGGVVGFYFGCINEKGKKPEIKEEKITVIADNKEIAVKPCPMCGGDAKIQKGFIKDVVNVECEKCGLTTKAYTPNIFYAAVAKAVEDWNRREKDED